VQPGATIPVSQTFSTIPADLVQDIMRLPYRQRFTILINELGAAVASRSADLQTALRRADPALAETDNLLALLADDAHVIRDLNANANTVITALANNSKQIENFVVQANNISRDSATQAPAITATWNKLPGFLEQLRPALQKLGAASDAQSVVFSNLGAAAGNLKRFFADLQPFSRESLPSLRSLGQASLTGKPAVMNAAPLVGHLSQFAQHAPELSKNLAIVLHDLDDRGRAVEADPRSPGGKGYTGLEALLEYVFNVTLAVNYFTPYGHELGVDAFANQLCSPYTTPATLANNIASYESGGGKLSDTSNPANPRTCYAFLGPNQPGVTTPDPSWNAKLATPANPSACVPDPGGYPVEPGYKTNYYGAKTNVCQLKGKSSSPAKDHAKPKLRAPKLKSKVALNITKPAVKAPPIDLSQTLDQILSKVKGVVSGVTGTLKSTASNATQGGGLTSNETQQLLNYLLAP
jgi:hypothetical protein